MTLIGWLIVAALAGLAVLLFRMTLCNLHHFAEARDSAPLSSDEEPWESWTPPWERRHQRWPEPGDPALRPVEGRRYADLAFSKANGHRLAGDLVQLGAAASLGALLPVSANDHHNSYVVGGAMGVALAAAAGGHWIRERGTAWEKVADAYDEQAEAREKRRPVSSLRRRAAARRKRSGERSGASRMSGGVRSRRPPEANP